MMNNESAEDTKICTTKLNNIKGEYLLLNIEITDTKSQPLEKLHSTGIDREEERK